MTQTYTYKYQKAQESLEVQLIKELIEEELKNLRIRINGIVYSGQAAQYMLDNGILKADQKYVFVDVWNDVDNAWSPYGALEN